MSRNRLVMLAAGVVAVLAIVAALVMYPPVEDDTPVAGAPEAQQAAPGGSESDAPGTRESFAEEGDEEDLPEAETTAETMAEVSAGGPSDNEDPDLQREAEAFVQELTEPSDEPLTVERLDTFVTRDRPLITGAQQAGSAETVGSPTPGESGTQVQADTAVDAAGEYAESVSRPAQAPEAGAATGTTPAAEAEGGAGDTDESVVDLPLSEDAPVTIAALLDADEVVASDAVFYVHTVQPDDDQGIWGIIHEGITANFAEGIAMRRGGTTETYRIDIPADADEIREEDNSSSFLGRLIHEKTQRSWVYNLETKRVGKNPRMILPGQEIVIVSFSPEELIAIYKHFVRQREGE